MSDKFVEWLELAWQSFAVIYGRRAIGFGALSNAQAPLPDGGVEAVHTIVHPSFRRMGVGTCLTQLRIGYAAETGFSRIFFRVVPTNRPRIMLLTKLGIARSPIPLIEGFTWYEQPTTTELWRPAPCMAGASRKIGK